MGAIAAETFGVGKPGSIIIILVLIVVACWLAEIIATATGYGHYVRTIRTASIIIGALNIVGLLWKLLKIFFDLTQGKMS